MTAPKDGPKILVWDLETFPHLVWAWGLHKQFIAINQIKEPGRVVAYAAKWHGTKPVLFKSEFHDGREAMVKGIHELLEEADVSVTFNGLRFDVPHMNTEFKELGLTPPPPIKQVDLWQVASRKFKYPSTKLAYLTARMKLSGKMGNEGFGLWRKCMEGDEAAWSVMRRYARQDAVVTDELLTELRGWIPALNLPLFNAKDDGRPKCGRCPDGGRLHARGSATTSVGVFERYQCQDCGGWSRGGKRVTGIDVRSI